MKRRTFLGGAVGTLAATTTIASRFAGPILSLERERPTPPSINTSGLITNIRHRGATTLRVWVAPTRGWKTAKSIVAVRRRFPNGPVYESKLGDTLYPFPQQPATLEFEFSQPPSDPDQPWQYVAFAVDADDTSDWSEYAYLCETDPLAVVNGEVRLVESYELNDPNWPFDRTETEGAYNVSCEWYVPSREPGNTSQRWQASYQIGKSAYAAAKSNSKGPIKTYQDTIDSETIGQFGPNLINAGENQHGAGLESVDEAAQFRAFVRFVQNIPYSHDRKSVGQFEYYRAGEETLVDCTGDCEDSTYLLAGLLENDPFNYRTALLFPPGHVLPAVHAADVPLDCEHCEMVTLKDEPYVPIETTNTTPVGVMGNDDIRVAYVDGDWVDFDLASLGGSAVSQGGKYIEWILQNGLGR